MGWTSLRREPGLTDRQFFEHEFPETLGTHGQIVACATMPGMDGQRVFYAAVRNNQDAPHKPGTTWALVVLMRRSGDRFAYKEMSDSSGPAEDLAPAAVLDALSPTDSEYANDWRRRCRDNLARRAARPKVKQGDTVVFATPLRFSNGTELTELVFDQRNTFVAPTGGLRYRVPRWREREYSVKPAAPAAPPPVLDLDLGAMGAAIGAAIADAQRTTVAVGDPVLSWDVDEPVTYGGPDEHGAKLVYVIGVGAGGMTVKCDPDMVAPAGIALADATDPRIQIVKVPGPTNTLFGNWAMRLADGDGFTRPTRHKTKREATAVARRRLAIADWHAANTAAQPSAA